MGTIYNLEHLESRRSGRQALSRALQHLKTVVMNDGH